jgi:hypothetical protein
MKKEEKPKVSPLQFIRNEIAYRTLWFRQMMNGGRNPKRNIEEECGYPEFLTTEDYRKAYDRGDIADRIVSLYPDECFREAPLVYETEDENETEFEKAWNELNETHRIMSVLLRADILSGIGRFGIILIGIDDGLPLDQPVKAVLDSLARKEARKPEAGEEPTDEPTHKLLYLRTFDESLVKIKTIEKNESSPRYGQPVIYEIQLWKDKVNENGELLETTPPASGVNKRAQNGSMGTSKLVHWTRVIHLTDNRTVDEIVGTPRLQKVFNRVLDLHKIAGGSPEMFWKGGFPGISLEQLPSDEPVVIDREKTKEEMELYEAGLKRWMALEGMTAKSLLPNVADPGPHAELQIRLICIALKCPWRVFMGAEVGQLASGQDIIAWNGRVQQRRDEYVEPYVIRAFIDRLVLFGILPFPKGGEKEMTDNAKPKYIVYWNDLNTPSAEEQATIAEKRTNALVKYASGGANQVIGPSHFLELVMKFDRDEVEAIMDDVGDRLLETDPEVEREHAQEDEDRAHERELEKIETQETLRAKSRPKPAPAARR